MKKIFGLLLAGTLLFSGCSLMGKDSPAVKTAPVSVEENTIPENPEALFNSLVSANAKAWNEKISEYIPSNEVLQKNKTTFSLKGNGDLTPVIGAGKIEASLTATGQKDVTDEKNPLGSADVSLSAKTSETPIAIDVNSSVSFRVVNNSFFASLQKFTASVPVPQVQEMANLFVGKWYGNSFDEISALTQIPDFNLQKLIASKSVAVVMIETFENMEKNPQKFLTFKKALKSKNGMYFFEAQINPEGIREMMREIFGSFGMPQSEVDKAMTEFDKTLAVQKDTIITLGYNPNDAIAVSSIQPAINFNTGKLIEGKTNTSSISQDGMEAKIFLEADTQVYFSTLAGKITLSVTNTEKTVTPLSGTHSDTSLAFSITNPDDATQKLLNASFTKSGDAWSGEITSPQAPGKLMISNAKIDKGNVSFSAEAFMGQGENMLSIGKIDMNSAIEGVDSVSVDAPADFEPFENIQKTIAEFEAANAPVSSEDVADEPVSAEDSAAEKTEINLDEVTE